MMDWLSGFFKQLGKYDWLNILFPGVFFVLLSRGLSCPLLQPENWLERIGSYLLYGELCSRVGAIIIEPVIKHAARLKFVERCDFEDYRKENREFANILVTKLNFCRTLCAMGVVLMISRFVVLVPNLSQLTGVSFGWKDVGLVFWTLLLAAAYCRQVDFIVESVEKYLKDRAK